MVQFSSVQPDGLTCSVFLFSVYITPLKGQNRGRRHGVPTFPARRSDGPPAVHPHLSRLG